MTPGYRMPKMTTMLLVGFSSGLPLFLTDQTLQAWMTAEKVDLKTIGYFSLVGIPYSFKYLWSPLMDRFAPPFLGARRGWIAVTQLLLACAILFMAMQDPKAALPAIAAAAVLVAFLSASQDIVIDAYRSEMLDARDVGPGSSIWLFGYRIALLVTGAIALILADRMAWSQIYMLMAALMGLGILVTLFAPEPARPVKPPESLAAAVYEPFHEFFARTRLRGAAVLAFIVIFKLSDTMASNMATPFLKEYFSMTQIGAVRGGMGLGATILGTLAAAPLLARFGINRCLWLFGFLQMFSNIGYWYLSIDPRFEVMITIENFCTGLVAAGFVCFLTSFCAPGFAATQYALLSSLMAVNRIIVAPAGAIAKETGWPEFFLITLVAGLPGLLLMPFFAPWNKTVPTGAAAVDTTGSHTPSQ